MTPWSLVNYNQPFLGTSVALFISALKMMAVDFLETMLIAREIRRCRDSYGQYVSCHILRVRNVTLHI